MHRSATDCDTLPDLSPQQWLALDALLAGATVTRAAEVAGVHRATVARWLKRAAFCDALTAARVSAWRQLRDRALTLAATAQEVLAEDMADPADRRLRQAAAVVALRCVSGAQGALAEPPEERIHGVYAFEVARGAELPAGYTPLPVFGPTDWMSRFLPRAGDGAEAEDAAEE